MLIFVEVLFLAFYFLQFLLLNFATYDAIAISFHIFYKEGVSHWCFD